MNDIDAHVHVWPPGTAHYPLATGFKKDDMKPASFTPQDLFKHSKPAGVTRINLIQMNFYGFDNSCVLDMIKMYPEAFVGTAVTYQHSVDFVVKKLDFLTADERDWLMRRTAEEFFLKKK